MTSIVIAVGLIISLLAFFILLLSLYLLLQKNREKIHQLMQLGYSPSQVARYYHYIVLSVNGLVLVVALAVMLIASHSWQSSLEALGVEASPAWPTILIGVAIMSLISIGNLVAITRTIRKDF